MNTKGAATKSSTRTTGRWTGSLLLALSYIFVAALAIWITRAHAHRAHQAESLKALRDRVELRGLELLNNFQWTLLSGPSPETEKQFQTVESALKTQLDTIHASHPDAHSVLQATRDLRDLTVGPLHVFHERILESSQTDAIRYTSDDPIQKYSKLREAWDSTFSRFSEQIDHAIAHEREAARQVIATGLITAPFVLLVGLFAQRTGKFARKDRSASEALALDSLVERTSELSNNSTDLSKAAETFEAHLKGVDHALQATLKPGNEKVKALGSVESALRELSHGCAELSEKLHLAEEKSEAVIPVANLIHKVADQANLISLNGAIEAEKAGEYGLGFAVVAMEVRRFAEQLTTAAEELRSLAIDLRTATASTLAETRICAEKARGTANQTGDLAETLNLLLSELDKIRNDIGFRTVAAGRNAQESRRIAESLGSISEKLRQLGSGLNSDGGS